MLRAFNIHVDNPCCVLTQDESKKFINGKENDKYDFFLKATGLHSLREELREIKHNFDQTQDSLKIHEKSLHDKKQKVRELKEKFERLQRLALLQDNINLVSAKLTWRKVLDVEEKLQVEVDNLSEALQLRSQLEEELSRKSSCTDSFDDDIAAISAESNQALTQKSAVEEDINMKKALHRKNTLQVESMKTRIVDMQRELAANNNRKKLLEREISDLREKAKASANNEEKHLLDEIEAISR